MYMHIVFCNLSSGDYISQDNLVLFIYLLLGFYSLFGNRNTSTLFELQKEHKMKIFCDLQQPGFPLWPVVNVLSSCVCLQRYLRHINKNMHIYSYISHLPTLFFWS